MGKFQGTGYVNPANQLPAARMRPASDVAQAASPAHAPSVVVRAESEPRLEGVAKVRKAVPITVSKTVALTNAEHQARWRKAHPEQHAAQQRAARARRKAGKAPA